MDLKEFKRIVLFAKKTGVKSIKVQGFEIELYESALVSKRAPKSGLPQDEKQSIETNIATEPNLDQINQYIYGMTQEVE